MPSGYRAASKSPKDSKQSEKVTTSSSATTTRGSASRSKRGSHGKSTGTGSRIGNTSSGTPSPRISLLIPFSSTDPQRKRVFRWVLDYWHAALPDAEIVIGRSSGQPFCKTQAFNRAARKATGDIFVLLDADAFLRGSLIATAAERIVADLAEGFHLWFVPYRHLYRLTSEITARIVASDPAD